MNLNATLIIEVLSFLILLLVLIKFLYRPVLDMLDKRAAAIREASEEIQQGLNSAKSEQARAEQILVESRRRALRIKEKAGLDAELARRQALSQTKEEVARMLHSGRQEINQEVRKAREKIKGEIIDLSFKQAEQILRRKFSPEDQKQMLEELTKELTDGRGDPGR